MITIDKILKFAVVGVISTLIHVFIVTFLINGEQLLDIGYANVIAFIIATIFSYLFNTKWTYSTSFNKSNLMKFLLTATLGSIISFALSTLANDLGWHYLTGIALIVLSVPALTFIMHTYWTFNKKNILKH